jgi:ATP synthase protein I
MGIIASAKALNLEPGDESPDFVVLTREQVNSAIESNPSVSPWFVVGAQFLVGLMVVLVAWFLRGGVAGKSAACGAAATVIPSALFAWGLMRQRGVANAGSVLAGFFVWEALKIVFTVALLVAAARWVEGLNWLALLVGFVVTMKVYWLAMWLRTRRIDKND